MNELTSPTKLCETRDSDTNYERYKEPIYATRYLNTYNYKFYKTFFFANGRIDHSIQFRTSYLPLQQMQFYYEMFSSCFFAGIIMENIPQHLSQRCSDVQYRMAHIVHPNKQQEYFDVFRKLKNEETFTDVTFVTRDNRRLSMHKLVLISYSTFIYSWIEATFVPDLQVGSFTWPWARL